MNTVFFPQGNHKWRKPLKFLRDRINTKSKTPKQYDDLLTAVASFFLAPVSSSSSAMCYN